MEEVSLPDVHVCRALLPYEGAAKRLVIDLKYHNDRRLLTRVADGLATLLDPPVPGVVTWMPTTASRRYRRGYDQAALLARAVARRWGLPCRGLLLRRPGPPQTGRSLVDRNGGIAVEIRPGRPLAVPVVVVDDVVTTGATLRSGASALRAAGVPWIGAVAIARTPRGHG